VIEQPSETEARIVVVGIGADGWAGLTDAGRAAVLSADEVIGSARQLATLPDNAPPRRPWPSPMAPAIDRLLARPSGTVCVLASGDPMLHGIGSTLAARLGPDIARLTVHSHPSAFALACARLGWPEAEVELVSTVARAPQVVARALQPGRRVIVYATGQNGAAAIARELIKRGFGDNRFVVLEQLGGVEERVTDTTASVWGSRWADPLHAVAIEVDPGRRVDILARVPGLPDGAFEHDGALTKRYVRAATLAALAPTPGALLWDVGAGSGSIAIEWMRAEPTTRAIAIERRDERADRVIRNAQSLGVPALRVLVGEAPRILEGLDKPDAIFIGGGLTEPGVIEACLDALPVGGRLVANAVTLEGERLLVEAHQERGGELVRLEVSHAEPIGGFTGWRAQRPIVQWSYRKQ
jgi:precorrin-6B C5,15-methyltransferase / cobalt-precorrin-6B C5,C15-methyltransferase